MPEALAIAAVFAVAVAACVGAWLHSRDPANQNTANEVVRLRQQQVWLEQRLLLAQREKWGSEMIDSITGELGAISEQLNAFGKAA
jgi:hypothetical protein